MITKTNPRYSQANIDKALSIMGAEFTNLEYRQFIELARDVGRLKTYDAHGLQWDNDINNLLAAFYIDEHPEVFSYEKEKDTRS